MDPLQVAFLKHFLVEGPNNVYKLLFTHSYEATPPTYPSVTPVLMKLEVLLRVGQFSTNKITKIISHIKNRIHSLLMQMASEPLQLPLF